MNPPESGVRGLTVSVAMCTHNGAEFLAAQLQSILTQTHRIDELVVSDDGSSDGTLELLARVWEGAPEGAPRLTVLRNATPLGVARNFEQAVSACRSQVIGLCDQDDVWAPDRIERGLSVLAARPDLLLLHSDARLVDAAGTPLGRTLFQQLEVSADDVENIHAGRAFSVYLRRNLATGATVMFRSSLLEWALPFAVGWLHDEWLAVIAAAVEQLDVIEAELIDYRQHGRNEIGVRPPTLRRKVERVMTPEPGRNALLVERFDALRLRLISAEMPVRPGGMGLLDAKIDHERSRSALPAVRWRRLPGVLREMRSGRYAEFASRGRLDAIRDLLQPR